jgi:uncharacterized membrane protein YfcA
VTGTARLPRLVAIGLTAGLFSSLFGVGGGIVVVPLLIALVGFAPHAATATSIGAILITAVAGSTIYALHGEVRLGYAVLVGLPAVGGALVGTGIQRRLSGSALTLAFAALLAAIGIWLLAG